MSKEVRAVTYYVRQKEIKTMIAEVALLPSFSSNKNDTETEINRNDNKNKPISLKQIGVARNMCLTTCSSLSRKHVLAT
jgi:hypothetical protein